jgi:serine protease
VAALVSAPSFASARADTGLDSGGAKALVKHLYPTVAGAVDNRNKGYLGIGNGAGPLLWGGGPIQKAPRVYLTVWGFNGSDPSGEQARLTNFFTGVGGSSWANIQTQYHGTSAQGNITNPTGQLAGVWVDNSTRPLPVIQDSEIAAEAVKAEQHFGYSPDADYFVLTPPGTGTIGFKVQYCAWHSITSDGSRQVAFTNLPYITDAGSSCGSNFVNSGSAGATDGITIVGGHEYAEAVTDPDVSTGWIDASGQENGDKCAWISSGSGAARNISLSSGSFPVQTLYSNAASVVGACVISYP